MNSHLLKTFIKIKTDIEQDRGPFVLFALFEKNDAPGLDVVFAAEWTVEKPTQSFVFPSIKLIADKMLALLSPEELRVISGINPVPPNHPLVSELLFEVQPFEIPESDYIHLRNLVVYNIQMSHAYILAINQNYLRDQGASRPALTTI